MTMEQTFIVTGICAILIGTALGFLTYWAFEHDNRRNDDGES